MYILINAVIAATINTDDGFVIDYELEKVNNTYVILLHGLMASKDEWGLHPEGTGFKNILKQIGAGYVAIDLRGHGKSNMKHNKKVSINELTMHDFVNMKNDVESIIKAIKKKEKNAKFIVAGASLGANIAVNVAKNLDVKAVIMLSPGFVYAGVASIPAYRDIEKPVFLACGIMDTYSFRTVSEIEKIPKKIKPIIKYSNTNYHGVVLLNDRNILDELKKFIAGLK